MQLPSIEPIERPARKGELALNPGKPISGSDEQWKTYLGGAIACKVSVPTLTPMLPPAGKATDTAVVFAPSNGFGHLGMNDGEAQKLVDRGVTIFFLKYRTNPTERDPSTSLTNIYKWLFEMAAKAKAPKAANDAALDAPAQALEDSLASMRLVRSRPEEFGS